MSPDLVEGYKIALDPKEWLQSNDIEVPSKDYHPSSEGSLKKRKHPSGLTSSNMEMSPAVFVTEPRYNLVIPKKARRSSEA